MKIRPKKTYIALAVLALAASAVPWWACAKREVTLVELQKQYLFAHTDIAREGVIDKLEQHFLHLPVPDSLVQNLENAIQSSLLDTAQSTAAQLRLNEKEPNAYVLEDQLSAAFKVAMLMRARRDETAFQEIMPRLSKVAAVVDRELQTDYWQKFIAEAERFDQGQARAWLNAEKAEKLCRRNSEGNYFPKAEKYCALGLHYLEHAPDLRLRLNLMQRAQIILIYHYGLNDLAIALAHRHAVLAQRISFHLREAGIQFYEAEALRDNGEPAQAIAVLQEVMHASERHHDVPLMSWYRINALLQIASAYWHLGMYNEVFADCERAEKLQLSSTEKCLLHIARGAAYRRLGNYAAAESQYQTALHLAEQDTVNLVRILNNLGIMYYELTENDIALMHLQKALRLQERYAPENYNRRSTILLDMATVMAKENSNLAADSLLHEATALIEKAADSPRRHADLLSAAGKFNLEIDKPGEAIAFFQRADSICERHAFVKLGLDTKVDHARALIQLKQFSAARQLLEKLLSTALQIGEKEKALAANALLAKIESLEGHYDNAARISEQVIQDIEAISAQFDSPERLVAYRQKMYEDLKAAVFYEICRGRLEAAFQKLDYAKAASLKMKNRSGEGATEGPAEALGKFDVPGLQSQMNEHALAIDYLLMPDTLYAFVLSPSRLELFRKALNRETLQAQVFAYLDSIKATIAVFRNARSSGILEAHFHATTQLGRDLYQALLGWPELKARLLDAHTLYVIPDEFLQEVPFATLVLDQPDSTVFLIEKAALINLPSATFLQTTKPVGRPRGIQNEKIFVSADPQIPESDEFVAAIKDLFPLAEILQTDCKVTGKNDVLAALNQRREICIFAGHSVANAIDPDLSFIEVGITDQHSRPEQSLQMRWADLKQLDWSATELLLLVGCETAAGKLYRGSGISGLQQGFLSRGAQRVLASLWRIDAAQSFQQIQYFLKAWDQSENPAGALREMQLRSIRELRRNRYFGKPHPYFWGSFVLAVKTT